MNTRTITIELPEEDYNRYQQIAEDMPGGIEQLIKLMIKTGEDAGFEQMKREFLEAVRQGKIK